MVRFLPCCCSCMHAPSNLFSAYLKRQQRRLPHYNRQENITLAIEVTLTVTEALSPKHTNKQIRSKARKDGAGQVSRETRFCTELYIIFIEHNTALKGGGGGEPYYAPLLRLSKVRGHPFCGIPLLMLFDIFRQDQSICHHWAEYNTLSCQSTGLMTKQYVTQQTTIGQYS